MNLLPSFLGFISDAHGNFGAFLKGIELMKKKGVEQVFFLGDALGYIPSVEVFRWLKNKRIPCILGNHENQLLEHDLNRTKNPVYRFNDILRQLSHDDIEFMQTWPTQRIVATPVGPLHLVHGAPGNPVDQYIYPDTCLTPYVKHAKAPTVVMGHTHRPFIRTEYGHMFVNVGSCGMPRDDSRYGSVGILDVRKKGHWQIIRYNIEKASKEVLDQYDVAEEVRNLMRFRRITFNGKELPWTIEQEYS